MSGTRDGDGSPARAPALDVSGRVAIVTGGNAGIGLGIAAGLVAAGARVSVWGRRQEANEVAVGHLRTLGPGPVDAQQCDVSDVAAVDAALARTVSRLGPIDGCFANAGVMAPAGRVVDYPTDAWRRTLQINLDGTFFTCRAVAGHMVASGRAGSIVVTSSVVFGFGNPGRVPYAVSKAGQVALARTMAVELARHDIRVNALLPGWTDTDMNADLVHGEDERTTQVRAALLRRTPMARFATPDDFAGIATYLLSDASRYHTGDTITIDGGFVVR